MKKILMIIAALLLAAALVSCTGGKKPEESGTEAAATTAAENTAEATTAADTEADDPSVFRYEGLAITLPRGFSLTEVNGVKMAVPENYPVQTDNITFTATPASPGDIESFTAENIKAMFEQAYGEMGTVSDFSSERGKLEDVDCVISDFNVRIGDTDMHQKSCSYFVGNKCVTVTFTTVSAEAAAALAEAYAGLRLDK